MKTFLVCIFCLGIGLSANAQSAETILNNVSKKHKNAETYYIEFNYELINKKAGINESSNGKIYASKQKYKLETPSLEQIYNGKKLYTIDNDLQEIVVTKPGKDKDDLLTPTKILDFYKTGFNLSLDSKKTVKGNTIQYIKLTPKTKSQVKYYLVGINVDKNELYQYQEVNDEGTVTTINISKYIENLVVFKSLFKFNEESYKKKGYFVTP